jgi:hypothetical protein
LGFGAAQEVVGQFRDSSGAVKGFAAAGGGIQPFDFAGKENARRLGSSVSWFAMASDQIR